MYDAGSGQALADQIANILQLRRPRCIIKDAIQVLTDIAIHHGLTNASMIQEILHLSRALGA